MTFQWAREQKERIWIDDQADDLTEAWNPPHETGTDNPIDFPKYEPDDGPLTADQTKQLQEVADDILKAGVTNSTPEDNVPVVEETELDKWNKMVEEAERAIVEPGPSLEERIASGESYVDSEGKENPVYTEEDGSKKKTYMIKDEQGTIVTKIKE